MSITPDGLVLESQYVDTDPARRAVIFGELSNRGVAPRTAIKMEAVLLRDGTPIRRRDVWCCDDIDPDHVGEILAQPGHAHFQGMRLVQALTSIRPGDTLSFTAIFPEVEAPAFENQFEARLTIVASERVTEVVAP